MQTYEHGTFLIVLDCDDLDRAANFWCDALGYDRTYPQSGPYVQLVALDRGGVELLLQQTDDPKASKNRLHLDLRTPNLDAEVRRLTELGARVVTDEPLIEHDWRWHVLGDPDGNEFCVLQPPNDFHWPCDLARETPHLREGELGEEPDYFGNLHSMSRLDDLARRRRDEEQARQRTLADQEQNRTQTEQREASAEIPGLVQRLLARLNAQQDPRLDLIRIKRFRTEGWIFKEKVRDDEELAGYCIAVRSGDIEYGHPNAFFYVLSDGRIANASSFKGVWIATNVWKPNSVMGSTAVLIRDGLRSHLS